MTKTELKAYKTLRQERDKLAQQIEELEVVLYGPKSQKLDGMPHNGGGGQGSGMNLADKHMELERLYNEKIAELTDKLAEIEEAITPLEPRERTLIRLHYFQGLTWEQVAVKMNYSWRQVHRLHGKALEKLQQLQQGATR